MRAENGESRAREGPGSVGSGSPTRSAYHHDITPVKGSAASIVPHATDDQMAAQLRHRREASTRLPPMRCGHYDPIDCRPRCWRRR
jgi:hypothetical protein